MARQFNGTSDYAVSTSAINMSSTQLGTYCAWLWWDAFTNSNNWALDHTPGAAPETNWNPDWSAGSTNWLVLYTGDVGLTSGTFTRPSAAAWHHYCAVYDISKASAEIDAVYLDGVSQTLAHAFDSNNTSNLPNGSLYLMSNKGISNFGAGRLAELALWKRKLSQADATELYNSGSGEAADLLSTGAPDFYWKLCGTASPEPATLGGISMTLVGTTSATHPIATCGGGVAARRLLRGVGV